MSFNVNWNSLETDSLREWTSELLTGALNSGKRPNILASDITIKDLNFGKIAPQFEILEIGELDTDRFRGIFKINYSGDFHLTLHTQVQANPLKIYSDNSYEQEVAEDSAFVTPEFLLSTEPFNIPLDLKLSDIKISGIGIIVFSQSKGLTLVFRNDPLDSIKVSSTFDTVKVLSNFLQSQIETQIRDLFRETLPTLIHKYSLKYTSSFQNHDIMNNLRDHLKDQNLSNAFDSLELENVAMSNLKKLAKLYSSRETLDLNIPKLQGTVQRNHLEKFNRDFYPTLAHSLYSNMNMPPMAGLPQQGNSIPVDLLVNQDVKKVDAILKEISSIQTKSFRSGNSDGKRPKRRTFKLGKKMKKSAPPTETIEDPSPVTETAVPEALTAKEEKSNIAYDGETTDGLSDTSTVHEDQDSVFHHPTPVKLTTSKRPLLNHSLDYKGDILTHANLQNCPSPLSASSSFVGGVGLGNSFLNISPGTLCGSPLRNESSKRAVEGSENVKVKKSMNRVSIDDINEKLKMKFLDELISTGKQEQPRKDMRKHLEAGFEIPPPPYYQAPRAGF